MFACVFNVVVGAVLAVYLYRVFVCWCLYFRFNAACCVFVVVVFDCCYMYRYVLLFVVSC